MIWIWLCWCAFCAMLIELILGNHGLSTPLVAVTAFYFTVILGWQAVFVPLAMAGSLLDLILARSYPTFLIVLPAVMLLARFWRRQGNCRDFVAQALPGVLVGLAIGATRVILESLSGARWDTTWLWHGLWRVIQATAIGALLLPLTSWLLDRAAAKLALPAYRTIQDKATPEQKIEE